MNMTQRWFAVLALGLALGCGGDDDDGDDGNGGGDNGPFDLTFEGDDTYGTAHTDDVIFVAVVDEDTDEIVARDDATVDATGFSFTFPGLLEDGVAYRLDYFVDLFPNEACDVDDDHVWQTAIPAVTDDVTVTDTHDLVFQTAACDSFPPFDLTFEGDASYGTAHNGKDIYVLLVEDATDTIVDSDNDVVDATGFSFTFVDELELDTVYRLDYYVDLDVPADGSCDPTDHMWSTVINAANGDITLTDSHDLNFTPTACDLQF
jgi:hypothetical protein